jgi:hypothetical protein
VAYTGFRLDSLDSGSGLTDSGHEKKAVVKNFPSDGQDKLSVTSRVPKTWARSC